MYNHCPRLRNAMTHETITVQDQEMQCAYVATVHNKAQESMGMHDINSSQASQVDILEELASG